MQVGHLFLTKGGPQGVSENHGERRVDHVTCIKKGFVSQIEWYKFHFYRLTKNKMVTF